MNLLLGWFVGNSFKIRVREIRQPFRLSVVSYRKSQKVFVNYDGFCHWF